MDVKCRHASPRLLLTCCAVTQRFRTLRQVRQDMLLWVWGHLAMQLRVIGPIASFLLLFLYTALRSPFGGIGETLAGLFASAVGLGTFMLGLEIGLMPLGEEMGRLLPERTNVTAMLVLVFLLGAGCTFAEPAVNALQLAGTLVDIERSPYLWLFLAVPQYNLALVFAIAFGVGLAALVGTIRMIKQWPLQPVVYSTLGLTLVLTVRPLHRAGLSVYWLPAGGVGDGVCTHACGAHCLHCLVERPSCVCRVCAWDRFLCVCSDVSGCYRDLTGSRNGRDGVGQWRGHHRLCDGPTCLGPGHRHPRLRP